MPGEEDMPVNRREIDMLREASDAEHARIWREIRKAGDRVDARFKAHQQAHDQEAAARQSSRRWRVTAAIAAAASIAAVLGLLIEVAAKVH